MRAVQLVGPSRLANVVVPAEVLTQGDLPDHVLLRVEAAGVCGSDLEHFRLGPDRSTSSRAGRPGFPGHEVVGTVVASRCERWAPGDRVVGWATRFDALGEQVWTHGASLARASSVLPPTVAVLAQPMACALHVAARLAPLVDASRGGGVTVLGLGPMGLLLCAALDAAGAVVHAVDPVDRAGVARRAGAQAVSVCSAQEWAQDVGRGAATAPEVVVEAVGHDHDPLLAALDGVADGGTVYAFGIPSHQRLPLDANALVRRHLTLTGGTTLDRATHLVTATTWLETHLDLAHDLVPEVFALEDAQAAFTRAAEPDPARLKVVVDLAGTPTPDDLETS